MNLQLYLLHQITHLFLDYLLIIIYYFAILYFIFKGNFPIVLDLNFIIKHFIQSPRVHFINVPLRFHFDYFLLNYFPFVIINFNINIPFNNETSENTVYV